MNSMFVYYKGNFITVLIIGVSKISYLKTEHRFPLLDSVTFSFLISNLITLNVSMQFITVSSERALNVRCMFLQSF
jgi:hypothetical protein